VETGAGIARRDSRGRSLLETILAEPVCRFGAVEQEKKGLENSLRRSFSVDASGHDDEHEDGSRWILTIHCSVYERSIFRPEFKLGSMEGLIKTWFGGRHPSSLLNIEGAS